MAADHQLTSLAHIPILHSSRSASPAPPAPPLPPSRYLDVAKNFIAPFRYGAKPPREPTVIRNADATYSNLRGPSRPQSSSIRIGVRINALDISEDRTQAILAGRRVLKTIRVESRNGGTRCYEDFDLRATAIDHAHAGKSSLSLTREERALIESRQRETQGIEDVAWSSKLYSSYIATAGSNGKVILWDLNRPEVELARLHEHQRQVHKVSFNRTDVALLLSGSQDSTVRLWDLRQLRRDVMVCHSRSRILTQADGVRDVKWSSTDPTIFALGTEGGIVQRWDIRFTAKPQLKIAAHEKPCTTIAWHFDGKHLVSGGKDRWAKVWDLGSNSKRQKAKFYIRTPHELRTVSWRPPCNISDSPNLEVWQCAQLATSYEDHPVVHIWDWRREHMPHRELYFGNSESGPADMLWHSKDFLWTAGHGQEQGDFAQTDVRFIRKQLDRRNLQSFASSPNGEMVLFSQRRVKSEELSPTDDGEEPSRRLNSRSKQSSPMSRSPGDDSLDDNFLSAPNRNKRLHHSASMTLIRSQVDVLPLEATGKTEQVKTYYLKLDQILRQFENPPPSQWSKNGYLPGCPSSQVFTYLAQKYKPMSLQGISSSLDDSNLIKTFEQNASYAQLASLYRNAQTWRIFGSLTSKDLMRRAKSNRLQRCRKDAIEPLKTQTNLSVEQNDALQEESKPSREPDAVQNSEDGIVRIPESSSNVPTPLAKPWDNFETSKSGSDRDLLPVLEIEDTLELTPSYVPSSPRSIRRNEVHIENQTNNARTSATAHSNWYDPAIDRGERLARVSHWRAPPKTPLNPDSFIRPSVDEEFLRLDRQDSVDSFMMFSGSAGSEKTTSYASSTVGEQSQVPSLKSVQKMGSRESSTSNHEDFDPKDSSLSPKESFDSSLQSSSDRLDDVFFESEMSGTKENSFDQHVSRPAKEASGTAKSLESTTYNSSQSSQLGSFPTALVSSELKLYHSNQDMGTSLENDGPTNKAISAASKSLKTTDNAKLESSRFDTIPLIPEDFIFSESELSQEDFESVTSAKALYHLLKWYSSHQDAQMASHLLLCWRILLPSTGSVQLDDPTNINEAISDVKDLDLADAINKHLQNLSISPIWVESMLSTYHEQLMALNLLNPAIALRRLAFPAFPAVYEQFLKDNEIGILCQSCSKPINNPRDKMRCESCTQRQATCAICWLENSPFDLSPSRKKQQVKAPQRVTAKTTLWTSCLLCGHTNHAACLGTWFTDLQSEGACPVTGCLCDCTRGRRRDERLAALVAKEKAREKAKKANGGRTSSGQVRFGSSGDTTGSSSGANGPLALGGNSGHAAVRRDHWDVDESQAVGRARSALINNGTLKWDGARGGKRVRLVVPDDDVEEDA